MRIYAAWKLFIKAANGTAPVRGIATSGSLFYSWNNTFLRNPSYATIDPRFHDSTIRISSISFVTASSNPSSSKRRASKQEREKKNKKTVQPHLLIPNSSLLILTTITPSLPSISRHPPRLRPSRANRNAHRTETTGFPNSPPPISTKEERKEGSIFARR